MKLNTERLKERRRAKDKCEREREGTILFALSFQFHPVSHDQEAT